jgi:hypothetical protein
MIKIGTIGIILCILYAAYKESMGLTSLSSIEYVLIPLAISVILLVIGIIKMYFHK